MTRMAPQRSYFVCASPRSGSTLLCQLLADTGVAGRPEEFFEARRATGLPPHPGDYLVGLPRTGAGIRDDPMPPEAPAYSTLVGLPGWRAHLERTFAIGTTSNGVFGSKLMWNHVAELAAFAGHAFPELRGRDPYEILCTLFGQPRWVFVTRRDVVRQAVSMWRALQTRAWRLERPADRPEEVQLHYRYEGIAHLVRFLQGEELGWRGFFVTNGIEPLELNYEDDVAPRRDAAVRAVLAHIGISPPEGWHAPERLKRQADELSEQWVAAYQRDAGITVA